MKTQLLVVSSFCLTSLALRAAEGVSADWTQVAPADQSLMGDYQGEWLDAPNGHYFNINKPVAAQVVNVRPGEYALSIFQEHDQRADRYFEGIGKLDGDVIRFEGKGWSGTVGKDGLTGVSGEGHGGGVKFRMNKVVRSSPTLGAKPPTGALVLFDGTGFDQWQHGGGRAVTWHLAGNGAMEVRSARSNEERQSGIGGDIETKRKFGDCRIHLEFRYPVEPGKQGQGRGNSGFFFQGDYEVQILNSYGLDGRWNECGALYKASPPKVNAARPPMEWQTYDIDYKASVWKDGVKVSSPRITVRLNGVLVHQDQEIPHTTAHAFAQRTNEPKGDGPIRLQDHGNAIQFRNIWVLPGK
jgi:Domain of Unknown Function (DUF1080)